MKKISLKQAPKKFEVRCSSLPLLFSCTNAILNPARLVPVRVENGAEHLGTDIHSAIQHTVETGEINLGQIDAKYEEADRNRAHELYATGLKVVEEAKRDMKNPQFEVELVFETEKFSVTGHADVLDVSPTVAYLVDFKTGRVRDNHYHQMLGYAVGAWTRVGRPKEFAVHIAYVYLESGEVTNFVVHSRDMADWIKQLDSLPDRYTVNRRCVYCPLNNTCPAFRDYLRGSLSLLLETEKKLKTANIRKLPEGHLAKLATSMKMADTAIKRIREHLKDEALARGDIAWGNGNSFTIRTREYKTLLTSRALPVVAGYVTAKDVANATKLNLTDLLSAAARRVKGPMRKLIRDELFDKLKAAGAIAVTESAYLETGVTKPKKKKV